MREIHIEQRLISDNSPSYLIADIAANHDGDINRALDLISSARDAGANAVKFQHFRAPQIVSDYGFRNLGGQLSHQARWEKSVFEVYQDASLDWSWTETLYNHCKKIGIDFFSSPYDFEAVDHLNSYVPAYKIGSGDITWLEIIEHIARKNKPVLLATGASTMDEIISAVDTIKHHNQQICLMQCNTNYTGSKENFNYIDLNVLKTFSAMYPDIVLGLSDHTPEDVTVLGAIALGARVIEKHYTDDNGRVGPDHPFSMNPKTWKKMVEHVRDLESALGTGVKRIEKNEEQTVVLQRRCLRAASRLKKGKTILKEDIEVLRPAPPKSLKPDMLPELIGKKLKKDLEFGEHFSTEDIE